jgi:hypothetical protein
MPNQKNKLREHWYNFVVPAEKLERFYAYVQTIQAALAIGEPRRITEAEDSPLSIDVVLSLQGRFPAQMSNLMLAYDGINVSNLRTEQERRRRAHINSADFPQQIVRNLY